MLADSPQRYGRITRVLHWSIAVLVLFQFTKLADYFNEGENWVSETLVPWHISVGMLLLVLITLRILWALYQHSQRPAHEAPFPHLVGPGHFLLNLTLGLLPLAGILIMVGGGYGVEAFGLQLISPGPEYDWAFNLGRNVHAPLSWLVGILVLGHTGLALYHHLIRKDESLNRMIR